MGVWVPSPKPQQPSHGSARFFRIKKLIFRAISMLQILRHVSQLSRWRRRQGFSQQRRRLMTSVSPSVVRIHFPCPTCSNHTTVCHECVGATLLLVVIELSAQRTILNPFKNYHENKDHKDPREEREPPGSLTFLLLHRHWITQNLK